MLDYTHAGTAKVKVEYVGRAPLDGNDDHYLMASYKPGKRAPDPSDGLPTGVMIAMNGPTPSAPAMRRGGGRRSRDAEPMRRHPRAAGTCGDACRDDGVGCRRIDLQLPALGPIAPERPAYDDQPPAAGRDGRDVLCRASA